MKNIKKMNEFFDFLKKDKDNLDLNIGDKFKDKDFGDSELEILLISNDKKRVRVKFNIINGEVSKTGKKYEISIDTLFKNYQKI